jgi:hypothetical protein
MLGFNEMFKGAIMNVSLMQKVFLLILIPFFVGLLFSDNTFAAEKKDKAARRNALMMQKMKQEFETEKASMQAQFDAQKNEMELKLKNQEEVLIETEKKLSASEIKNRQLGTDLKKVTAEKVALTDNLAKTQTELDATKTSLADLNTQHQKALADLAFNDEQRKTQSENLAQTTKSLNACVSKNEQLYAYGKSLVQLYDNPSQYEAAMRKEKFLQLKRVELENILQGQLDKLDEARVSNKAMAKQ